MNLINPSHLVVRKTNLAFERQFRITSREIKDQKADDVLPKIFRGAFDWNKQYLQSKKNRFSIYLDRVDKYFDVETFKLTNDQIVSLFTDVTARQHTILELEENKHRYQVLLEAIPDLFFIIDKDGIYVDFVFKASDALKIKPEGHYWQFHFRGWVFRKKCQVKYTSAFKPVLSLTALKPSNILWR